jgi:hypothetical protein
MKALLLVFSLSLISFNSFSQEVKANDCCPYGNNCGGRVNCPGSGWNKRAERREIAPRKNRPASSKSSGVKGE